MMTKYKSNISIFILNIITVIMIKLRDNNVIQLLKSQCFGICVQFQVFPDNVVMNVKKQQMQLQLQPQRRHNRTGFETLLLQDRTADESAAVSPPPGAPWSPADAGRYRHHRRHDHLLQGPNSEDSATPPDGAGHCSRSTEPAVTTPPPPSPLSLPSPYYDRNPIIGFPLHQHHHSPKSPTTATAAAAATIPLANVQNVVYTSTEQDLQGDHHANNSKVSVHLTQPIGF